MKIKNTTDQSIDDPPMICNLENYKNKCTIVYIMATLGITVTTVDSEEQADSLSRLIIEQRLAACVQIDQISSYYNWDGEIQHAKEFRLFIKHPVENTNKIHEFLEVNHTYDLPEILQLTGNINQDYLDWCNDWSFGK